MVDSWFDMQIPTPESSPEPKDVKGKGIAVDLVKERNLINTGFRIFIWVISSHTKRS